MTKQKRTKFSKRRLLVFAIPVIALIGIGGIIAYSRDRSTFTNNFKLAGYQTLFTETFDAPQNWKTCDTIDKTITVTNDADSSDSVAVRVKLEEQWLASDGTTELPLVSVASGLTMAQINFTPNSGWTKKGDYYYYDTDLAKGATTSSLITGVTLNCDANLSVNEPGSDGAYADGTYYLKITAQAIDTKNKDEWGNTIAGMMKKKANPDTNIDFTKKATIAVGNGNGVSKYTEKGRNVYYYRGEVYDNNVIWADKCWKILRTTYTGGTKIVYNGVPSDVVVNGDTVKQCLATGQNAQITVNMDGADRNYFSFNDNYNSPADVGYMYGERIAYVSHLAGSISYTFSNDVSRSGNTYALDTSAGQSISGTWEDRWLDSAVRYHYFCTDGSTVCDSTKIGYIVWNFHPERIYYLGIGGYDDIEAVKDAMFTNTTDSNAKTVIETWFEQQNLDGHISGSRNYEDDLEDAIFCNDRTYYSGALKNKDSDASYNERTMYSYHGAYGRNRVVNANNNYEPLLDCPNRNDAFTKNDTINGNAKLGHRVGLITADELTMAGTGRPGYDSSAYLYANIDTWSISPTHFDGNYAHGAKFDMRLGGDQIHTTSGFRPVVSLKAGLEFTSGTGLKTDPYIIE